ncbi:MAG: alkaline phosphatase D family protein, partial [Gemmatimonadota bacterium]|nr:alkaline phosphatase D family protein [Gemmatimonadota bacterium]
MRAPVVLTVVFLSALFAVSGLQSAGYASEFHSNWPVGLERAWAGPEYWANPLQDWRISRGRLECHRSGGDRNVYLITRELAPHRGEFEMSVTLGQLEQDNQELTNGWAGFRIGSRGEFNDYRDSAIRGQGLNAGLTTGGRLFIGDYSLTAGRIQGPLSGIRLRLRVEPAGNHYKVSVRACSKDGKELLRAGREDVHPDWLTGSVALVCSTGDPAETDLSKPRPARQSDSNRDHKGQEHGGNVRFWFRDWSVSGSKVDSHEARAWGPVLFTQHTLSRRVLKLTAHMAPVGNGCRVVGFQVRDPESGRWKPVDEAVIDPLARTAEFRVRGWDDTRDTPYRIVYPLDSAGNEPAAKKKYFTGTVRKDPRDKEEIIVAAFTGNNDFGFPHADIVRNVSFHQPDLLVYTGDQIYERTGGYDVLGGQDVNLAALDYLRRWYMFGWEYRDLLRDIPSVCLPDDHDVFHGNIWGAGGKPARSEGKYSANDRGGYRMPPVWVNMVQRTQTSHMADPYDPAPIGQGISVYYGAMQWGGISFAVIEDRKWKSSPLIQIPEADIVNGWAQNPDYDAATDGDVPGAVLLGQRQLDFLEHWAADWSGGTWMKVVISQTIFANVVTKPPPANSDNDTPRLKIMKPGEYAEGEIPVQDHDSNGWPQTGRNKALDRMRRCFAFHIAGDQHLGSTIQYGIDHWHDAGFALCVPSVANVWPRRWFPPEPGRDRKPGSPRYTGD